MELLVGALEETGLAEESPLGLRQKRSVDRGDAMAPGKRRDALGGPGTRVNGTATWSLG